MQWDGRAPKPGEAAPDLELWDETGRRSTLSSVALRRPLVVIAFGGAQDRAGLSLLRDYRDETLAFWRAGARICAVGSGEPEEMRWLRKERGFAFPLLCARGPGALSATGLAERNPVLLLDGDLVVRHRAWGEGAAPEAILSLVRRGEAGRTRPSLPRPVTRRTFRERLAGLGQAMQHAFRALGTAR